MSPDEQLLQITSLWPSAQLVDYSGQKAVFLPGTKIETIGGEVERDLLFVPVHHQGQISHLYYSDRIDNSSAQNWGASNLLNQNWWKPSYGGVDQSLCWRDQILLYLKAVM